LAEIEMGPFRGLNLERVPFEDLAADLENDYKINERRVQSRR